MPYIGNQPYQGVIDSGNILNGSIDTVDLKDGSVTSAKLETIGGLTAGSYTTANITVDSKGRVTLASNGSGGVSSITGTADQITASASTGAITLSLPQSINTTSSPSFANITLTGEIRGPSTLIIDPTTVGDDTGIVRIRGDLQVDGTTTTINSTTLEVADLNITLAKNAANAAAATGAGITVAGASATLTYAAATDTWNVNKNILITPGTGNGILYLNANKVATTGSVLTFNGTTTLSVSSSLNGASNYIRVINSSNTVNSGALLSIQTGGTSGGTAAIEYYNQTTAIYAGATTSYANYFVGTNPDGTTPYFAANSTGIGIGTNNPSGVLDAGGNTLSTQIYFRNNGTYSSGSGGQTTLNLVFGGMNVARIANTGTGQRDGTFQLLDENTIKVSISANASRGGDSYIHNGGNFGIGTTSPGEKLTTSSSNSNTYTSGFSTRAIPLGTNLRMENTSSTTDAFTGIIFVPTSGSGQGQISYLGAISTSGGLASEIVFGRRSAATNYAESVRITSAGNVGINQASPRVKLNIDAGSVNGIEELVNLHNQSTSNNTGTSLTFSGYNTVTQYPTWRYAGIKGIYDTAGLNSGNWGGQLRFFVNSGGGAAEFVDVMTITSTTRVGIGTSLPDVSLDIGSKTDGIRIPNGNTAQRPNATAGNIRYNTDIGSIEYSNGLYWYTLQSQTVVPTGLNFWFAPEDYTAGASSWTARIGGLVATQAGSTTTKPSVYAIASTNTSAIWFYVAASNVTQMNVGTGDFTIECWFYNAATNYGGWRYLIGKSAFWSGGGGGDYGIYMNSSGQAIGFHTTSTNGIEYSLSTMGIGWKHIVATRNSSGRILYVNSLAVSSDSTVNSQSTNNPFSFGNSQDNSGYGDYRWQLGSCRFYTRALASIEVLQNFNAERNRYGV